MTAAPMPRPATSPRQPPVAQNQAANGTSSGSACGLVMSATAMAAAAQPLRPLIARTAAASADSM